VCEVERINPQWTVVFIMMATVINGLGRGLHNRTALFRSTQTSTLCGVAK